MKDYWSRFNEFSQNAIGLAIVATYLYMTLKGLATPVELRGFALAVLIFYGYKSYKATNGATK